MESASAGWDPRKRTFESSLVGSSTVPAATSSCGRIEDAHGAMYRPPLVFGQALMTLSCIVCMLDLSLYWGRLGDLGSVVGVLEPSETDVVLYRLPVRPGLSWGRLELSWA